MCKNYKSLLAVDKVITSYNNK